MTSATNPLAEGIRAAGKVNAAEKMAARIARGLPAEPPPPVAQVGNVLQPHQVEALHHAIAGAPPAEQGKLIDEAHRSLTEWIDANQGKVIIDGQIHLAKHKQDAESLAARILNKEIAAHDRRAGATVSPNAAQPQPPAPPVSQNPPNVPQAPQIIPPKEPPPKGPAPKVSPREAKRVGAVGDHGRQVLQPKNSVRDNQKLALEAAPELHSKVSAAAASVPGAAFTRMRPVKDTGRLQEKTGENGQARQPETISDYAGAQVSVDSPQDKEAVLAALHKVLPVVKVDDNFDGQGDAKAGYASTNVQGQLSNGSTAEIQIVPKEVAEVNDDSHPYYEAGRAAEAEGDTDERDAQWEKASDINQEALDHFNARVSGYTIEPPNKYQKGDQVKLKDGSDAVVQYAHPSMNLLRVRTGGKTRTIHAKEIE